MQKNNQDLWTGRFITSSSGEVKEEPIFSLEEMFTGQVQKQEPVEDRLKPPVEFKRIFAVNKQIRSAQLDITAHGIYQAYLNSQRTDDALLAPDFTEYNKFLQYQSIDVTDMIKQSTNILGIVVADGWYAGRISVPGGSCQFGKHLALLLDLTLKYEDGTEEIIGSDDKFTTGSGKWCYADLQIGEKQDLRKADDWLTSESKFSQSAIYLKEEDNYDVLTEQTSTQVKRKMLLNAKKIWHEGDAIVVDFGQVIAGRTRLKTYLKKGQTIKLEHAEALNEEGGFFKNIVGRNKDQTDVFIGRGQEEILEPDFTCHGFRYVKITGLKELKANNIKAVVIFSDLKQTGHIHVSNKKINRLLQNVKWSQRGNMVSIPTDCPQRERMGWTGDMQVFAPASTFYYDTESFIARWLKSVRLDQLNDGEIVDYSPAPKDFWASNDFTGSFSSAGWGDAIIMVPWTLYQRYGHKQILEENYSAMVKWHEYCKNSAAADKEGDRRYIWNNQFNYGDWMFPSYMMKYHDPMKTAKATSDLVGTAFLAHSASLLGKISEILDKDAEPFNEYADTVKAAFTEYFLTDKGLKNDFQGCYVLTLAFDMVPNNEKDKLVNRLVNLIHENGDCLDTGFLSVPYLLDVLCDNGQEELAKKIFLQEKCPSWLYEVDKGATTIWESWSNIQPNGKIGDLSFNHYAMGCVLDWFIRRVCGLNSLAPGYKQISLDRQIDLDLDFNLSFESVNGLIKIWKKDNEYHYEIPDSIEVVD